MQGEVTTNGMDGSRGQPRVLSLSIDTLHGDQPQDEKNRQDDNRAASVACDRSCFHQCDNCYTQCDCLSCHK